MTIFCNQFLSCVIGKHDWKRQTNSDLIREFATISDEAFALQVLENIWERWIKMDPLQFFTKTRPQKNRRKKVKNNDLEGGQWTSESARALRCCGWSIEGITRFNLLCEKVKVNRQAYP